MRLDEISPRKPLTPAQQRVEYLKRQQKQLRIDKARAKIQAAQEKLRKAQNS